MLSSILSRAALEHIVSKHTMLSHADSDLTRRSVRAKNATNIMLKNLLDACVGALGFWSTGYAFAYGKHHLGPHKGDYREFGGAL